MDLLDKRCQILNETSTGIGHAYRGPLPSEINIESQRGDPLPPLLRRPLQLPPNRHFLSLVSREHDRKAQAGPLTHPRYSKAVPHWNVNFVDELGDREVIFQDQEILTLQPLVTLLRECRSAKTTTPPLTEMQDRYRGRSAPQRSEAQNYTPLLALSRQFETDKDPALKIPSISTAQADYRRYDRSELLSFSSFDEEAYKRMPPPKSLPAPSCQPFLHRPLQHVPHGGRTSTYRDSFGAPRRAQAAPVPELPDWPSAQANSLLHGHILKVPKIYCTENQGYGGNKMTLV